MSEFLSANWIGLIGAFTGISAIIISVYTYRKEKPNLKVSVTDCHHRFTVSTSQIKTIFFFAKFHINNVGDRGTRINDIGLSFKVGEKEYHGKQEMFWNVIGESKWIDAHDNADIGSQFLIEYNSDEKDRLNCVFTIYHTHNPCKVKAVSEKFDKP
ncbi:MAG: hypothetical protein ABR909_01550 [Candidatus Bathyarchaeia archaeon]|jgi:hypothetical protein